MTPSAARSPEHDNTTPETLDAALAAMEAYCLADRDKFERHSHAWHGADQQASAYRHARTLAAEFAALASTPTPGENPYRCHDIDGIPSDRSRIWDAGYAAGLAAGRATADTDPPPLPGDRVSVDLFRSNPVGTVERVLYEVRTDEGHLLAPVPASLLTLVRRASSDHPASPEAKP